MTKNDELNLNQHSEIKKAIAIDLDDTLNDFSETVQRSSFTYNNDYPFSEETFKNYLKQLRSGIEEDSNLISTEYSAFKRQIHEECYRLTSVRADGVEFMKWLRKSGWQVIICTARDLRRANDITVKWLKENDIPFDYLFMASNKIVFCKLWGIEHLVDDAVFNIVYGERYGVNVYYPIMEKHQSLQCSNSKGFKSFDEVKQWIGN